MKSTKNSWIVLLPLLLVALQSAIAFGSAFSVSSSIENHQDEIGYFKTKNTKAIVSEQIPVFTAEYIALFAALKSPNFFFSNASHNSQVTLKKVNFLIDLRGILSTQIFPFHTFL
ncbi:MAG: hypothetical protein COZ75_06160 [Flavobacteriaceae bacterium CG_4_8_14_3_um_filter_34_10]|nr:hypothetical protein [Flavobacteriia bacterium]PIV48476.1 MAG: hypothetical protein COS19_13685 [Flavobacteriaceae bacterium CG02_land_8_20_14_3_00_34_13]PIX09554.1 MAG: hypothetical protein COZ75_06160 [Flavobacteriaceae bacterium CG_4_8_14_3_um_filter_34_10]PIZ07860.1 MAG: hypothetical protein COY56_06815 [Flavobacteriaceae bacterium CG_4_10_14_0_8_um_filter_34_31]PJC06705.1 MAG: hypothetical protein CO068_09865 [Flavobacteriaceae bacterium CG_4_9_14_0_8_um_filter_34_30]